MDIVYIGNVLSGHGATITTIETLAPQLEGLGYEVATYSSKKSKLIRAIDMLRGIYKHRKSVRVVIIDTYSTFNFWYAVAASILCRMLSIPYIPILHGGDLPKLLEGRPYWSRQVFSNSKINVAPSRFLQKAFVDKGYATEYIPNNININNYSFRRRANASLNLLWVRSLHKIYNPLMAVRVVDALKKEFNDVKLCLVGPDKDGSGDECRTLINELKLADNVEITGSMPKNDWIEKSAQYDIFINTTTFDNMPVSIIEALALGFPIVSTNVGGLPWLLDDGIDAFLVPSNDVKAMVGAIKKIHSNPEIADSLSMKARIKGEEFDWAVVGKQWKEVINS